MSRPDPIEYAERLYAAIRAANFSPMSFLAFGNAVKDGVAMRNMPRIAAEPFMRIVGEVLELEEEAADGDAIEATVVDVPISTDPADASRKALDSTDEVPAAPAEVPSEAPAVAPVSSERKRNSTKR